MTCMMILQVKTCSGNFKMCVYPSVYTELLSDSILLYHSADNAIANVAFADL